LFSLVGFVLVLNNSEQKEEISNQTQPEIIQPIKKEPAKKQAR
jgi:hypothetical protein